jgi:hypothetical protein
MTHETVTYYAGYGFNFEVPVDAVEDCSHSGQCDADVDAWHPEVDFSHISDDDLARELSGYTDWDVSDRETNEKRILWIAAGNIKEERREKERGR